jgi:predicted NACHT family NTPase
MASPLDQFIAALATAAATKGVAAIGRLVSSATEQHVKIDTRDSRMALLDHLGFIEQWAEEHSLADRSLSVPLRDIYVELSLSEGEVRTPKPDERSTILVHELAELSGNYVILGKPGAGKTTSLQHIARATLAAREAGNAIVPLVVRFRLLRAEDSLISTLLGVLGISVTAREEESPALVSTWERRALTQYLDSVNALLLLDGLDEAPNASRADLVREISELILHSRNLRLVMTCRTGAYLTPLPKSRSVTVAPLRADQVESIATRWLGEDRARRFLASLRENPVFGTEVLPLILAQLCVVYRKLDDIPTRPSELYQTLVRLLIEDWDLRRGTVRRSRYASWTLVV